MAQNHFNVVASFRVKIEHVLKKIYDRRAQAQPFISFEQFVALKLKALILRTMSRTILEWLAVHGDQEIEHDSEAVNISLELVRLP